MTWDPRKQLESEDSPPSEAMKESARMIFGAIALAALALGLMALWG